MKKSSKILTQALQYAMIDGYSVIPVGKDKRPLLKSWSEFQKRIATEEEIREWWRMWPEANVAIITGKISKLTVIDVDSHKGGVADPFPKTHTIKTGNGGLQLYYAYVEGFTVSANAYSEFPHIDLRSDGGYVVAAPSVITPSVEGANGKYEIVSHVTNLPLFPADQFRDARKMVKKSKFKLGSGKGSRNNDMASTIGTILLPLRESQFDKEGWEAIQAINDTYNPPLPLEELKTTFESIAKKEIDRRAAEVKKDEEPTELDLMYITRYTQKGPVKVYTMNLENICRVLRKHPSFTGRLRHDNWRNVMEIRRKSKGDKWMQMEEADVLDMQAQISMEFEYFQKIGKDMVYDAMLKVAKENVVDTAVEYFRSIKWDGVGRIDTWLCSTYGSPDNVYIRAVGANYLKGMVKRVVHPGSKFDFVLVLEGPQGARKSTSLGVLGGDWHVETTMSTDSKDFFMQFGGKAIIEFSEGETLSRTEVKKMKAIITMQVDKYRPPYERVSKDFPRRCVFAMTTNQDQYLKDETGNRRWLPVKVIKDKADVEWLKDNRDQLFAEAYHRAIEKDETVWEFPEAETKAEQDARRISDPNTELIAEWYYDKLGPELRDAGVTIHQVFNDCMHHGFATKPMQKYEEMQIAGVLKDHLELIKKDSVRGGKRAIRWFPKGHVALLETEEVEAQPISIGSF